MSTMRDVQSYAKLAGVLLLLSIIAGGLGEFYIPSTLIVARDAAATAGNIAQHNFLFRLGFAAYLLEAVCDITLAWVMYILLRPVRRDLALLSVLFGVLSTATFAGTELFYFSATFILGGADYLKTFTPAQLESLALLSLKFYGVGAGIFMAFYGIASTIRGYLIYRSDYFPRFLGVLVMIAGVGFILKTFALVLTPSFPSDVFTLGMPVAGVALTVWMLTKGVDAEKWNARVASGESPALS